MATDTNADMDADDGDLVAWLREFGDDASSYAEAESDEISESAMLELKKQRLEHICIFILEGSPKGYIHGGHPTVRQANVETIAQACFPKEKLIFESATEDDLECNEGDPLPYIKVLAPMGFRGCPRASASDGSNVWLTHLQKDSAVSGVNVLSSAVGRLRN